MGQLTSAQISEWQAYDKLDPIGTWREDYRMAYLASLMFNLVLSMNGEKDDAKYTIPYKFMPQWDIHGEEIKEPVKQSIDEMVSMVKGIASRNKSKPKRIKEPPRTRKLKEKK